MICIEQDKQVTGAASTIFSRTFYTNVYSSSLTVCEAFSMARSHVEMLFGASES